MTFSLITLQVAAGKAVVKHRACRAQGVMNVARQIHPGLARTHQVGFSLDKSHSSSGSLYPSVSANLHLPLLDTVDHPAPAVVVRRSIAVPGLGVGEKHEPVLRIAV